ncbi:MAG: tetratricopeptide repeat protein [Bacteroidia bacterium]|nr:tetratricopeptide repeat protein [Bacteroidia bacterium]
MAVHARDSKALFELANLKYQEGKHDSSALLYSQIIDMGYISHELHFNAGNAFYKTGDFSNAILNYERALKTEPGNTDYLHNLKLANDNIVDRLGQPSLVFYEEAWQKFLSTSSANTRGIIGVVLLWIAVILFALYLFMNNSGIKKISFFGTLCSLIIGFLFLFIAFIQHNKEQSNQHAIIFAESEYVKSSPNDESKNLFLLHSGTKVKVIGELNDWKQVKLPNGNSGWIIKSAVEII